jgi:hypothetical protein
METKDVQNGASESVALEPVEMDELVELDKAGIDNSTDKAGVGNSKELGADNLMEPENMEDDKVTAESDSKDHHDAQSLSTTNNRRSSKPSLTLEAKRQEIRMGKQRVGVACAWIPVNTP